MPQEDQCPAFLIYPKDILFDGKVEAMTTEQFGAYCRLLFMSWFEKPVASIPADDEVLAKWARLTPETWSKCRDAVLSPFKPCKQGRYIQPRLALEYRKLMEAKRKKSVYASVAAKTRWNKNSIDANALRTHCGRNADAMRKNAISFSSSIETPPLPPASGGRCADDLNSFEASFSETREFVLDVWKAECVKAGRGYAPDANTREGARILASAIDLGQLPRELLAGTIRNGLADKNLPNQGLRGIAQNYSKYMPSKVESEKEARKLFRIWCDSCGVEEMLRLTDAEAATYPHPCGKMLSMTDECVGTRHAEGLA